MIGRQQGTRAAKQAETAKKAATQEKHKKLRADMEAKKLEWAKQKDLAEAMAGNCEYPDCKGAAFPIEYFSTVYQHRFVVTLCPDHVKAVDELRNADGAIDTTEHDKLMALPDFTEIKK